MLLTNLWIDLTSFPTFPTPSCRYVDPNLGPGFKPQTEMIPLGKPNGNVLNLHFETHFMHQKIRSPKPSAFQLPFSLDIMTSPSETELTDVANFVKKQKQQSMEFPGSLNRW